MLLKPKMFAEPINKTLFQQFISILKVLCQGLFMIKQVDLNIKANSAVIKNG